MLLHLCPLSLSVTVCVSMEIVKPLRPSHTRVRFDTVTRGRSISHAPGISVRKRRQASVIVHFQAVTASLFAANASIRRLPRINFLFKNSWHTLAHAVPTLFHSLRYPTHSAKYFSVLHRETVSVGDP